MKTDIPYAEQLKRYSMADLESVCGNLDKDTYPDRYKLILQELEDRKRAGEIKSSYSVPMSIAAEIWWSHLWISTLFYLGLVVILAIIISIIKMTIGIDSQIVKVAIRIIVVPFSILISIAVMRYVLSKPFSRFHITIHKKETIQQGAAGDAGSQRA